MHQPKRWNIAPVSQGCADLAARLKTSPLIAQILLNRKISTPEECQRFLSPSLKLLHDPADMPNLMPAAERIAQAIRDGEKIVIYGDYDVDGITATAILLHAIRLLGGLAEGYIPHRLDEGYGLNADAITQICDDGAQLIVTVDCGITAIAEARLARQRSVDLIVTDHHECRRSADGAASLPECLAIVHPRLDEAGGPSTYANPNLCGAGVAFKLAWGIGRAFGGADRVSADFRRFLIDATGLAALGTIADVVPLTGENRLLAHFGLGGLQRSEMTGIQALIESAGLGGQKLDSFHVGFRLAPRLNACGRMGHAREALEMLTVATADRAREIATGLEQQNRARQTIERQIFEEAVEQVRELGYDREDCHGMVLAAEGWHPGVIGIVASRMVGRFHRPTVMIALGDDHGHGSARSIPGFHLARALEACRKHLETCGGHEMAAGLRVDRTKLETFREAFCDYARLNLPKELLTPELRIDAVAELRQINEAVVTDLARLGPFGTANPRPLLCCLGAEVGGLPRRVGRSAEHLQFIARQGNASLKCIGFGMGGLMEELQPGTRVDLAIEPTLNEYNGYRNVELEVKDLRLARS